MLTYLFFFSVRVYGPGIESNSLEVGEPTHFTVETFAAGQGHVDVIIENSKGQREPVEIKFNNDKHLTYTVSYNPQLEGVYKVIVRFSGRDIPKSPYQVRVGANAANASRVTATGPGLQPDGVVVNKPTYFEISTQSE